jgi:hypothetical protein
MAEDTSAPGQTIGPEDKVRKDLVQVFFGLVLTQIAVYISSLVRIWDPSSPDYRAAWCHVILAFALTTTSWFGWQMSMRTARLKEEASVFQLGFVLSILDILLVTMYFLLVHKVELEGVAAFPPSPGPRLTTASATAEACIITAVYFTYALWDLARWFFREVKYGAWPSVVCTVLAGISIIPATTPMPPVLSTDFFLIGVVFLFRAFKRLQKWNARHQPGARTYTLRGVPGEVILWVVISGALCLIAGACIVCRIAF